jgi:hypothetical protein
MSPAESKPLQEKIFYLHLTSSQCLVRSGWLCTRCLSTCNPRKYSRRRYQFSRDLTVRITCHRKWESPLLAGQVHADVSCGNGIRVGIGKSFLNPASQHGIANTMSFSGDNLPCLLYDLFSDQRHSALNIKIPDLYSLKSAYPY